MSLKEDNRALRRLVADLSEQPAADIAAVLDKLSPDRRRMIEEMLALYTSRELSNISPWIVERLTSEAAMITPHTLRILRECVQQAAAGTATPSSPTPSLLSRLKAVPIGARDS